MPMYDFVCGDCRAKFELVVRMDQQVSCERCGGQNVRRLFPRPALVGVGSKAAPPKDEALAQAAEAAGAEGEGGEEGAPKKTWEYKPDNPYSTTNDYYGDDL